MRIAPAVKLTLKDREWVTKMIKSALTPRRLHDRCLVVLLAANGKTNEEIAKKLKVSRQKVGRWRYRFAQLGRAGIESDRPGRGRKPVYTPELRRHIVKKTTTETPQAATHWSRASMALAMEVSPSTVGRIWREHGLKPHLSRTFKVSKDPHFAEKLEDVIGLYLNAPEHAIVLCCDEKSQVQAWIAPSQVYRLRKAAPAR
jgi:transposase